MGSPASNPVDGPLFSPQVADALKPPKFLSAVITLASYVPRINSFNLEVDNTLSPRPDATDASGYLGVLITDRTIKSSIDPEMVVVATFDFHGNWFDDIINAFQTTVGATPGNIIDFYANKFQIGGVSDDERDGTSVAGLELMFITANLGDDEVVIAFL